MDGAAAVSADGRLAVMPFVDPASTTPMIHLDTRTIDGRFIPVQASVHDVRRLAATSLDREGFVFQTHETAVADFYDEAQILAVYYPEIEALVRELTGARTVLVFGHIVRGDDRGQRGSVDVHPVSDFMHCDFTDASAEEMLRLVAPPETAEAMLQGRVAQMNIWRPIRGPLQTKPLAVCDGSTLAPQDYVRAEYHLNGMVSEFYVLSHDPAQRWYFAPDMRADELLVLKNYDSDHSKVRSSGHGAFDLIDAPADPAPRESIEVRAFVGW